MRNPLKSFNFRLGLLVAGAVVLAENTYAQITNTPAGVATIINTGVAPAYDTALSLGIAVVGIGFVVYFIRKGFKARG